MKIQGLLCLLLTIASARPGAAQPHTASRFYLPLHQSGYAAGDLDLLSQSKRLLALFDKAPVADFSTSCASLGTAPHRRSQSARTALELARTYLDGRTYLDAALQRLRVVWGRRPSPEVGFLLGMALSRWEEPADLTACLSQHLTDEAVQVLTRVRSVDPDYRAAEIETELAVLYTRSGDYAGAADAYRRALSINLERRRTSTLRANLAEVMMLDGDLEGALLSYARALQAAQVSQERALALWGQAVAQDRLGEHEEAIDTARRAMALEGGEMRVLRAEGVFFMPTHEVHQYEALGFEARARDIPAFAPIALEEAAQALRNYLEAAAGTQAANFSDTAKRDLDRIEAQIAAAIAEPLLP